jgi:hypothetical protein
VTIYNYTEEPRKESSHRHEKRQLRQFGLEGRIRRRIRQERVEIRTLRGVGLAYGMNTLLMKYRQVVDKNENQLAALAVHK